MTRGKKPKTTGELYRQIRMLDLIAQSISTRRGWHPSSPGERIQGWSLQSQAASLIPWKQEAKPNSAQRKGRWSIWLSNRARTSRTLQLIGYSSVLVRTRASKTCARRPALSKDTNLISLSARWLCQARKTSNAPLKSKVSIASLLMPDLNGASQVVHCVWA